MSYVALGMFCSVYQEAGEGRGKTLAPDGDRAVERLAGDLIQTSPGVLQACSQLAEDGVAGSAVFHFACQVGELLFGQRFPFRVAAKAIQAAGDVPQLKRY